MTQKSRQDRFIEALDTAWKQRAVLLVGLSMIIAGPVIASTFRTPPGVALISLGSILVYFAITAKRSRTKRQEK